MTAASKPKEESNDSLSLSLTGWNYVLFGVYHGTLLCLYRVAAPWRTRLFSFRTPAAQRAWRIASIVITFHVVTLAWSIFEPDSIQRTGQLWFTLATNFEAGLALDWVRPFLLLCAPLLVINAIQLATGDLEPLHRFPLPVRSLVYAVLLGLISVFGEDLGVQFLYFQF